MWEFIKRVGWQLGKVAFTLWQITPRKMVVCLLNFFSNGLVYSVLHRVICSVWTQVSVDAQTDRKLLYLIPLDVLCWTRTLQACQLVNYQMGHCLDAETWILDRSYFSSIGWPNFLLVCKETRYFERKQAVSETKRDWNSYFGWRFINGQPFVFLTRLYFNRTPSCWASSSHSWTRSPARIWRSGSTA